ncbi:MAG TPA: response regulator [Candidatus Saccharimonadales bacterium]|nr:response regulator [Candidatus Saccharimonadales bacterium]
MRRILVVEDDDLLRESYKIILSSGPYFVETAENGKVGLQRYKQNNYDLVLLDIMMPVMGGVEFLKSVASLPRKSKIILLTNLSDGPEVEAALKAGAVGHLLKADISPKQLISKVRYEVEATRYD